MKGKPVKHLKTAGIINSQIEYPKYDLLMVILIYFLLDLIFYRKILPPSAMVFGTDWLAGGYPIRYFFYQFDHSQWNPFLYGGLPHFSNAGDVYFPITILLKDILGLPVYLYYAYLFVLNTLVGGVFTYLFLKELKLSFWPSFVGGIAYMFTGILVSYVYGGHEGRMAIVALLPTVMWLIHVATEKQTLVWFLGAGLGLGFSLLIPHVQMNYYLLIMVFFYFCFRLFGIFRATNNWPKVIKLSGYFLIFIAIGFLLSAVLYLPFYKYIPYSPRGGEEGRGYQFATSWAMPPEEAVNLAIPDFSGTSVDQGSYWGRNPFKLNSEYLGSTVVFLFFLTLFCLRKNKTVLFFLIVGLLSFTVAWGASTPLYKLYYSLVPGFKKFRAPSLIYFLIAFSAVVISAHGFHYLIEQAKSQQNVKQIIKFVVIFVLIVIGLSFLISIGSSSLKTSLAGLVNNQPNKVAALEANFPKFISGLWKFVLYVLIIAGVLFALVKQKLKLPVAGVLIALITVIDLWIVESKHVQAVSPPEVYFAPDEMVQALQNDKSLFRILPLQYRNDNYPMLFNLQSVAGEHGNQLQRYNEFVGAGKASMVDYHNILSNLNFLNLSNAKYLITQQPAPANIPSFKEIHRGRLFIYENLDVLPRAFAVSKFEVIAESDKILQRIGQPDFNPRQTVILEKMPLLTSTVDSVNSTIRIVDYQPMKVKIQAELDQPGFLVLLENYYPDWRAYVDDKETEIFRADYTFRAVALEPGQHQVEFIFEPKDFYLGKKLSLLSFVAVLTIISGNLVVRKIKTKPSTLQPS